MLKRFSILFIFLVLFFAINHPAQALSKFSTVYQVSYTVDQSGATHVKYYIHQKNNLSVVYATEFSLSVNHTKVDNVKVSDEGGYVIPETIKTKNQTIITFPFANRIVGKDKVHQFAIEYDTTDVATKYGNTWQINLPKLEADDNIVDKTIILTVPSEFPAPAYIDPSPTTKTNNTYFFSSQSLGNKPVSAVFGQTQYYHLKINYHLSNDSVSSTTQNIPIPPDTAYQSVVINSIQPPPEKITEDQDGNWLAQFTLKPNQKLDISLDQTIKVNFKPTQTVLKDAKPYLQSNSRWDFNNTTFSMQELSNLSSPFAIFDYVSNKLTYDYQKVLKSNQVDVAASSSLKNFQSSICIDYTNVFIALARKAGIPSREVQGYALSENLDLNPLSLSQDVLHSWSEYYDNTTKTWIQVDPTWTSTTHGIDYFNKLDLNHITFVIHGHDPNNPISPGGYKDLSKPQKDVEVTPLGSNKFPDSKLDILEVKSNFGKPSVVLENKGQSTFRGNISINSEKYIAPVNTFVRVIPKNQTEVPINFKSQPWIFPSEVAVIITQDGQSSPVTINIPPKISPIVILSGIGFVLAVVAFIGRHLHLRRRKQNSPLHR